MIKRALKSFFKKARPWRPDPLDRSSFGIQWEYEWGDKPKTILQSKPLILFKILKVILSKNKPNTIMNDKLLLTTIVGSIVRSSAIASGAFLATYGITVSESHITSTTGIIVTASGFLWSLWQKRQAAKKLQTAVEAPAVPSIRAFPINEG